MVMASEVRSNEKREEEDSDHNAESMKARGRPKEFWARGLCFHMTSWRKKRIVMLWMVQLLVIEREEAMLASN